MLLNTPYSRHSLISLALMLKTLFNIQKGIISILKSKAVSVQIQETMIRLNQQHILMLHVVNYNMNCINAADVELHTGISCLFLAYILDRLYFSFSLRTLQKQTHSIVSCWLWNWKWVCVKEIKGSLLNPCCRLKLHYLGKHYMFLIKSHYDLFIFTPFDVLVCSADLLK